MPVSSSLLLAPVGNSSGERDQGRDELKGSVPVSRSHPSAGVSEPRRGAAEGGRVSTEHAAGEQHVPEDLTSIRGDQREPVDRCHRLAQLIDEIGDHVPVVPEGREVQTPHGSVVLALLETKVQARRAGLDAVPLVDRAAGHADTCPGGMFLTPAARIQLANAYAMTYAAGWR